MEVTGNDRRRRSVGELYNMERKAESQVERREVERQEKSALNCHRSLKKKQERRSVDSGAFYQTFDSKPNCVKGVCVCGLPVYCSL